MATSALIHQPLRLTPLTLWHLLSLDAPSVATLWTIFAARALHAPLPPTLPPTMFLAVWLIYAADRLLDTTHNRVPRIRTQTRTRSHHAGPGNTPSPLPSDLHPRHLFPQAHLLPFAFAILLATSALAVLIPTLPPNLLRPYLFLAALLLAWFVLVHFTRLTLPKELVPGLFFAVAVFLPTHHASVAAIAFAALCTLNCLYIHRWEHPRMLLRPANHVRPSRSFTSLLLRHLPQLTLLFALIPLIAPTTITLATSLAALALLLLNHHHHRLPPTTLRAAADLALLTPVLILPFLH